MSKDRLSPIPIPFRQRCREARARAVPMLVFTGSVALIAFLWGDFVAAPSMVGQAEPVVANVTSHKAGVLSGLKVTRFQKVRNGDTIGQVLVADPKVLAASIASIEAEVKLLNAERKPLLTAQRAAVNYDQLKLNWMRERTQLATAKVNLQLAGSEFERMEELFKDKIVAQRTFDQAKATRDRYQAEVEDLTKLVAETEKNLQETESTMPVDGSGLKLDPLQAAIEVQQANLRRVEAELSPVVLTASMDGVVTAIYNRSGEGVVPGKPIVSISTLEPVRIVGYLRAPIPQEPKVGMKVEVRTRGARRQVGQAEIMEVGTQLEAMPQAVLGPAKVTGTELALLVGLNIPPQIAIKPGELVDIVFVRN